MISNKLHESSCFKFSNDGKEILSCNNRTNCTL